MITKEEIQACEEKLLQAIQCADIAMLDELLHDDLIFNAPTGELITKEMDLAVYISGNMIVEESVASNQEIRLFVDTAIVTVTIGLKGRFMQQPINGKFRYVRTWKKVDNRWKMIGGGCTPIAV